MALDMNVTATSPTIVGVLTSVSSALKPQDIEITPSDEEQTVTADEGYFIRTVIVKAIPTNDGGGSDDGGEGGNTEPSSGDDSGDTPQEP